jgi:hypothetical protein
LNVIDDTGEYAIWDLLARRGSLDVDGDLVDYHDDNCPVTFNPGQGNICAPGPIIPEPGTFALLGLGLAALAARVRNLRHVSR